MAYLAPSPKLQFFDANGNPLAGGKLYTYAAGTTTPLATYTDSTGVSTNTNPIILDSRGEANIWLSSNTYKFKLANSADVQVWVVDNIDSVSLKALLAASSGSSLVGHIATGTGAVATTVQNKLREHYSVFDFMTSAQIADVSGRSATIDVTTAIQAAIDAVSTAYGGELYFPPGIYLVTAPLVITYSNVVLMGAGGDNFHDGGVTTYARPATKIKYDGAVSTESIFTFKTIKNVANAKISNVGCSNMWLDCNGLIAGGLTVLSVNKGVFQQLNVTDPTYSAYVTSSYAIGELAEAADCQHNLFLQCTFRCLDAVAAQSAHGFTITGTQFANSSFNTFMNCTGQHKNGHGYYLTYADNNSFYSCSTIQPSGTGKGLYISGADSQYFYGFSALSIRIVGLASGAWANVNNTAFLFPDQGNATPYPTLDANCSVYWQGQDGVLVRGRTSQMVLCDSVASAISEYANLGSKTVIIGNASGNHMEMTDYTRKWLINFGSTYGVADLRFTPQQAGCYIDLNSDTVSAFQLFMPGMATTASAANVFIDTGTTPGGQLKRSTSSIRYKTNVQTFTSLDTVGKLRPIIYNSLAEGDAPTKEHFGLIAEEVVEVDPRLVHLDASGNPDGVQYERITVLLIDKIQQLEARLTKLENKSWP